MGDEIPGIGVMMVMGGKLPPLPLRDIRVDAAITGTHTLPSVTDERHSL